MDHATPVSCPVRAAVNSHCFSGRVELSRRVRDERRHGTLLYRHRRCTKTCLCPALPALTADSHGMHGSVPHTGRRHRTLDDPYVWSASCMASWGSSTQDIWCATGTEILGGRCRPHAARVWTLLDEQQRPAHRPPSEMSATGFSDVYQFRRNA
jgi:hypothetical protein